MTFFFLPGDWFLGLYGCHLEHHSKAAATAYPSAVNIRTDGKGIWKGIRKD